MNKNFDIDYQFDRYLERVNLKHLPIDSIQYIETKRAFYAGAGQILLLLSNELTKMDDGLAIEYFDYMLNQVKGFYNSQK